MNPFDRITEDQEVGIRKPIGSVKKVKRVRVAPPRPTFDPSNGEEIINF